MSENFINFGDFCRKEIGMQCQYGSRYLTGFPGYPNLGEGLRFTGNCGDYHAINIHKDDAAIFKERMDKLGDEQCL